MSTPADAAGKLLAKAEEDLATAQAIVASFPSQAARIAYLAAFNAARAGLIELTGDSPKTHRGVRSTFAKLALEDDRLGGAWGRFLARGFRQKEVVDYRVDTHVTPAQAHETLDLAEQLIARIKAILNAG